MAVIKFKKVKAYTDNELIKKQLLYKKMLVCSAIVNIVLFIFILAN